MKEAVGRVLDILQLRRSTTKNYIMIYDQSKKIYYEQYQLREEGGMGNAGGKREAANKPDQGEGYRAARGGAARGDRAGWPAERRQVGGGDWEEFKGRGDLRAQGEMGEGSPRRPRGRACRAPGEGGEDREGRKVRGDLRAEGRRRLPGGPALWERQEDRCSGSARRTG